MESENPNGKAKVGDISSYSILFTVYLLCSISLEKDDETFIVVSEIILMLRVWCVFSRRWDLSEL